MLNCITPAQVAQELVDYKAGRTAARYFACPIRPASLTAGLCYGHAPLPRAIAFYIRCAVVLFLLRQPFSRPKLWALRRCGARVGSNVSIATDVWIDPLFLDLLEIQDDVTIGVGAKISMHLCTTDEFRVGRVTIRKGAVIGGFALLGPGIEVGESAMVAGGSVVGSDVPAHTTAIGNPARIIRRGQEPAHA